MTSTDTDQLSELRDRLIALEQQASPLQTLEPHQTPPDPIDEGWLIQAGRFAGKTAAIAAYVTDHIHGPSCIPGDMPHKMALIAPTIGDAVESADRHPICLRTLNPGGRLLTKPGGTIFSFTNGSEMKLFGVNNRRDVDHLRSGGNNCLVWAEELASWPELSDGWDQMQFGLRIGPHPHWVGSSTPKNRPEFRDIIADPHYQITRAHSYDNPHIGQGTKDRLERQYGNTMKGRQELGGELLDEVEGAHWKRAWIDDTRLTEAGPMGRVVVGVDPQGSAETGMTGIVAAGVTVGDCACGNPDRLPHAYILEDGSIAATPDGWAQQTVAVYDRTKADRIAAERNFGFDMVESTLRTVWASAPINMVHASRGKLVRAEPVAALYEQGRVHHVGGFPELEDELTTYTVTERWSPNRLDALVWAVTELEMSKPVRRSRSGMDLTSGLIGKR
jgi:phage terminase large subunit-like protein